MSGDQELFEMVRRNRECSPGGTPVILANEAQARKLLERAVRAEKVADARYVQLEELKMTYRIRKVVMIGAAAAIAAFFTLLGYLMA